MYRKILLAYDGSAFSAAALREGSEVALFCNAEVHVLEVVDTSGGFGLAEGAAPMILMEQQRREAQQEAEQAAQTLRDAHLTVTTTVRVGHPAAEIIACAREIQADLVVIGHTGKGLLARWLQGSVGEALVDHLPCSLLVAAGPDE